MKTFEQCPFIDTQVVAWGDMDAFGHVNNVNYYKYIETARINYLSHVGLFDYPEICVIASNQCRYIAPVIYPDTLKIGVSISEMRTSGFKMEYYLFSTAQQKMVAYSEAIVVMMTPDGLQKVPLNPVLRERILALESTMDE